MKAILKNSIKASLFFLGTFGLVFGVCYLVSNSKKLKHERELGSDLIEKYQISEEYLSEIQKKKDLYKKELELGLLTNEEYDAKLAELLTDEYAKSCLLNSNDIEFISQHTKITNNIKAIDDESHKALLMLFAGGGSAIYGATAFKKPKKEKDSDYEEKIEM